MSPWQELLLLVAGIAAGYINVMAGGGSLLTVPFMVFLGLPGPVANGTNRIAILAQSVTAIWVFFRKGLTDLKLSLTLALFTLPGAVVGAYLGVRLDGIWFNRLLAAIMLTIMMLMLFKRKPPVIEEVAVVAPWRVWLTHVLMLVVGFYGGLIQVGVGFVIMPILHRVLGLDLLRVNMHKVFIVLPFTLVSLAVFASNVELELRAGIILALGMGAGGWLSTHLMIRRGERLIKIVFNLALLGMVIKLLFFTD
jgi:hypothetical protein